MKKHIFYGITAAVCFFLTGCTGSGSASDSNQAYTNEGEDEAVNTIQVGGRYRITGPMDDLKDAVSGLLGENYWPRSWPSAPAYRKICTRISLRNISTPRPASI